jgi:hypothetical protein
VSSSSGDSSTVVAAAIDGDNEESAGHKSLGHKATTARATATAEVVLTGKPTTKVNII